LQKKIRKKLTHRILVDFPCLQVQPENHPTISVFARLLANLSILFQLNSHNSPFSKTILGFNSGRFATFLALFSVGWGFCTIRDSFYLMILSHFIKSWK